MSSKGGFPGNPGGKIVVYRSLNQSLKPLPFHWWRNLEDSDNQEKMYTQKIWIGYGECPVKMEI